MTGRKDHADKWQPARLTDRERAWVRPSYRRLDARNAQDGANVQPDGGQPS